MRSFFLSFFLGSVALLTPIQILHAVEITSMSGGGETLYAENTLTPKTLSDLIITGDFGTGNVVSIGFRGASVADLRFVTSGVIVTPDGNTTADTTTYPNDTTITFNASGNGSITVSNIVIYINAGNNANDTENLKITLESVNYFAQDITINTDPIILSISGGGNNTVYDTTPIDQTDLIISGHFKTGNTIGITFNGNSSNSDNLKFKSSGVSANDGTDDLPITYTDTILSFTPSGSNTITISGIGIYLSDYNEDIDTETLKITLDNTDYQGDSFGVGAPPLSISGGGGITIPTTAIDPLTASALNDLVISGNFGTNENIVISFESATAATLNFKQYNINIQNSGTTTSNLSTTATSISFDASGQGDITLSDIGVFIIDENNANDRERLKITIDNVDSYGDYFSIIGLPVYSGGTFSGAAGASGTFIIGDTITYDAPAPNNGETFTIDLSSIGLPETAQAGTAYEVVDGTTDTTSTTFTVTVSDNAGNTSTFNSSSIAIDNQAPEIDISNTTFLSLPTSDTVGNIGDSLTFTPSIITDTNGDDLTYSIDFSDIGGGTTTFTDQTGDQSISIISGSIDTETYTKTITFKDDAGNIVTTDTNALNIDNQAPILSNTDIISINNGESPATIGDQITLTLPSDTSGDAITLTTDLSSIGGTEAIYTDITENQTITVTAGSLNNVAFSANFTVTDETGNSTTANSDAITIDNQPASFDLSCGGTFTVIDNDPSPNNIADYAYGGADSVNFMEPDNSLPGCDFLTYSIDLSDISGDSAHNFVNEAADGDIINIPVVEGDLDSNNLTFVLRIKDLSGNEEVYASGELNIDNDIFKTEQGTINIDIPAPTLPSIGGYYRDTHMPISIVTVEIDITQIMAFIEDATESISLSQTSTYQWSGDLYITPGSLSEEIRSVVMQITDDAGNTFQYTDSTELIITNVYINFGESGGGVVNLHRNDRQITGREVVSQQNKKTIKQHQEEQILKKSAPEIFDAPHSKNQIENGPSFISPLEAELLEKKALFQKQKRVPKALENKIKNIIATQIKTDTWSSFEDNQGGFRLQNSLKNLSKKIIKNTKSSPKTLRKTDLATTGKYGKIRFK